MASTILSRRVPIITPRGRTISLARFRHSGNANAFAEEKSFPHPTRPDLHYHFIRPPTPISASRPAFALSFLPTPPQAADSCAIVGWLAAVHGEEPCRGEVLEGASLNKFRENPKFRDVLHRAVREGLKEGVDDIQVNSAIQLQRGWLHIHGLDERNIPPLGRIGDPNDIIASILVEEGKILSDTYQPMPAYRLCTADGVTKLTPGLTAKLQSLLRHKDVNS